MSIAGPIFCRFRMPRDGATTFGDLVGQLDELRVTCEKRRRGATGSTGFLRAVS